MSFTGWYRCVAVAMFSPGFRFFLCCFFRYMRHSTTAQNMPPITSRANVIIPVMIHTLLVFSAAVERDVREDTGAERASAEKSIMPG